MDYSILLIIHHSRLRSLGLFLSFGQMAQRMKGECDPGPNQSLGSYRCQSMRFLIINTHLLEKSHELTPFPRLFPDQALTVPELSLSWPGLASPVPSSPFLMAR